MPEWLSSIFDLGKLPAKVVAWISFATALLIFLPKGVLGEIGLADIPAPYKIYLGLLFIASSALLLVNVLIWCISGIRQKLKDRADREQVVATLSSLDRAQRAVLREFYLERKHVLEMPIDHPTVAGLLSDGVLILSGTSGYRSLAGSVFPCALSGVANRHLTPELLLMPSIPTPDDLERVRSERPNFVYEIAERDKLRGGVRGLMGGKQWP